VAASNQRTPAGQRRPVALAAVSAVDSNCPDTGRGSGSSRQRTLPRCPVCSHPDTAPRAAVPAVDGGLPPQRLRGVAGSGSAVVAGQLQPVSGHRRSPPALQVDWVIGLGVGDPDLLVGLDRMGQGHEGLWPRPGPPRPYRASAHASRGPAQASPLLSSPPTTVSAWTDQQPDRLIPWELSQHDTCGGSGRPLRRQAEPAVRSPVGQARLALADPHPGEVCAEGCGGSPASRQQLPPEVAVREGGGGTVLAADSRNLLPRVMSNLG
jgi:hypothetical protein